MGQKGKQDKTVKRYYWLKLKEDFFQDKEVKKLRKIAGGDTYTVIYLKLMLLSLKSDGKLYFDSIEDTFHEELALEIDEDAENVRVTLMYLERMGLLTLKQDDEICLTQMESLIMSESESAQRVREHRAKKRALLQTSNVTECNAIETNCNAIETNCNTYIEEDIDIDINNNINPPLPPTGVTEEPSEPIKEEYDFNKHTNVEDKEAILKSNEKDVYKEIIDYLNAKSNSNYRHTTKTYQKSIHARINEGYTIDDFKTVIDKKCDEWIGTEWEQYLSPNTLFAPSHFDKYLNQKVYKRSDNVTSNLDNIDIGE